MTSPSEAVAKIHQAERDKKEAVPLLVTRNGTTYYLALQLRQRLMEVISRQLSVVSFLTDN